MARASRRLSDAGNSILFEKLNVRQASCELFLVYLNGESNPRVEFWWQAFFLLWAGKLFFVEVMFYKSFTAVKCLSMSIAHFQNAELTQWEKNYRIYPCISRVSGTRFLDKISGVDLYRGNVFGHVAAESSCMWYEKKTPLLPVLYYHTSLILAYMQYLRAGQFL